MSRAYVNVPLVLDFFLSVDIPPMFRYLTGREGMATGIISEYPNISISLFVF